MLGKNDLYKHKCIECVLVGMLGIQGFVAIHSLEEAKQAAEEQLVKVESELVSKYENEIMMIQNQHIDLVEQLEGSYQEQIQSLQGKIESLNQQNASLLEKNKALQEEAVANKATQSNTKQAAPTNMTSLGRFRISFYDTTYNSQEGWGYQTASGMSLKGKNLYDKLIAAPPNIPLGSKVYLEFETNPELNGTYTAVDRGGAIKGNKIDVFYEDNNMEGSALDMGIKYAKAYLVK